VLGVFTEGRAKLAPFYSRVGTNLLSLLSWMRDGAAVRRLRAAALPAFFEEAFFLVFAI
jgi:hypothetical protein